MNYSFKCPKCETQCPLEAHKTGMEVTSHVENVFPETHAKPFRLTYGDNVVFYGVNGKVNYYHCSACGYIIAYNQEGLTKFLEDHDMFEDEWDVKIQATVVKTIRVRASDEQKATELAHEQFTAASEEGHAENYEEETLEVEQIS